MFRREKEMDLGQLSPSGRPDPVPAPGGDSAAPREPYVPGRLALALFTVAVLAAAALMFVTLEGNAVDDPVKQAERGEVGVTSAAAMTREENMVKALRAIEGELDEGGYIDNLRVAPARINAIVVQPSGRRQTLAVNVAFEVTSADAGTGEGEGLQPRDIDPAAPAKIIRVAGRKFELRPQNFDYMVTSRSFSETRPGWTAFWKLPLKDNDVAAAADGTDVRMLGTPDAAARRATKAAREATARAQARSADLAQCLSRADTTDEIQRCLR
jgi:hypothetical protein